MKIKLLIVVIVLGALYYALKPCPCHQIPNHGCKKPCVVEEDRATFLPMILLQDPRESNETDMSDDDDCTPGWTTVWVMGIPIPVYVGC